MFLEFVRLFIRSFFLMTQAFVEKCPQDVLGKCRLVDSEDRVAADENRRTAGKELEIRLLGAHLPRCPQRLAGSRCQTVHTFQDEMAETRRWSLVLSPMPFPGQQSGGLTRSKLVHLLLVATSTAVSL